ncbi:uncharacterized protein DNG_09046 [Cephalotrichum gorgonifer]|uniref:Uncharacterized protein n=1 Tax=Cephalotrichum gorgonifer TaxID=2041049 RepID=A0AAE8N7L5_9PEZI|nr:uncharacterized protein DNG_09046 [Cephalotrichum gorgonifer]
MLLQKPNPDSMTPSCPCAKRQGIWLLGTCKQIHEEASPIFWAQNAFLFRTKRQFLSGVIWNLSAGMRKWIRHVVIVPHEARTNISRLSQELDVDEAPDAKPGHLWEGILQCSGLRTLQIYLGYTEGQAHHIKKIPHQLPKLESIRTCLLKFRAYNAPAGHVPVFDPRHARIPAISFLVSLPLPYKHLLGMQDVFADSQGCLEARLAHYILRSRTNHAITDVLGIPTQTVSTFQRRFNTGRHSHYPYAEVQRYINNPTVEILVEGGPCRVHITGLPLSRDDWEHALTRRARDRRLRTSWRSGFNDAEIQERFWSGMSRRTYMKDTVVSAVLITAPQFAAMLYHVCRVEMGHSGVPLPVMMIDVALGTFITMLWGLYLGRVPGLQWPAIIVEMSMGVWVIAFLAWSRYRGH